MHAKPLYHPANDFQPVIFVADAPLMLMVKKDLPANNLKEFIDYTKTNHGSMTFSLRRYRHLVAHRLRDAQPDHGRRGYPRALPRRRSGVADVIAGRIDYICNYISIGVRGHRNRAR